MEKRIKAYKALKVRIAEIRVDLEDYSILPARKSELHTELQEKNKELSELDKLIRGIK